MIELANFPKVFCPFIRQHFDVDKTAWEKHGSKLYLREPKAYLVVDRVNPGYEWVFEDPQTFAVEKLHGTNVKIKSEKGRLLAVQNRTNIIDPLQLIKGNIFIMEGIWNAAQKGYVESDAEQAGEVIGPKLQGNPYELDFHLWYPFNLAVSNLRYTSFEKHERNFDNWSSWFKDHLFSRFFTKRASKLNIDKKVFAEGVIFYNLKRKEEGKPYMAKLRRDMYPWFYEELVPVIGYKKEGLDINEEQLED